jgi:hypothetical protein
MDAHELTALVAPHPVFITAGTKDRWSDPHGQLAFRNHDGVHTDAPDSPAFLEMAQRDFDAPVGGARR